MPSSRAGCTGKRSRTGFVRLGEFGERELASDFRLLEEAALLGEAAGRTRRRLERGGVQSAGALGFMLRQVWHLPCPASLSLLIGKCVPSVSLFQVVLYLCCRRSSETCGGASCRPAQRGGWPTRAALTGKSAA